MKLKGHDLTKKSVQLVVIPRGYDEASGEKLPNIVLKATPIQSFEEFNVLVPAVQPPQVLVGGELKTNEQDELYLEQIKKRNRQRMYWLILKSLEHNEIEWESVRMGEPKTWANIDAEFDAAGFTGNDVQRIVKAVLNANNLNPALYDEALADFQRGLAAASANTSGRPTGPSDSQSGPPAEKSE